MRAMTSPRPPTAPRAPGGSYGSCRRPPGCPRPSRSAPTTPWPRLWAIAAAAPSAAMVTVHALRHLGDGPERRHDPNNIELREPRAELVVGRPDGSSREYVPTA